MIKPLASAAVGASALALIALASPAPVQAAGEARTLNIYTTREKDLIAPLLGVFEGLARVKINLVALTGDPIPRLKSDAADGKVDLFVAAELSELIAAKAADITEPVTNADLASRVPEADRDGEGHWFGLSQRVRVVAVSRERVKQTAFTYEELAEPKWKGKVCTQSGLHPFNAMLTASMIAHKGPDSAETWLRGLKANLATKPAGGDREQVIAVQAGKCDVALVDSSSVGALLSSKDPAQQAAGNAVKIVFPNATDRGAHVGASGMALIKDAPGLNTAALLMDFLTSPPGQFVYAQDNHEYPIRTDVKPSGLVESWGAPKLDEISLEDVAKHKAKAEELIRKVGFDNGPGS